MFKTSRLLLLFLFIWSGLSAQDFTITRTSAPIFYTDIGETMECAYVAYIIENTSGTDYNTVSATIGSFTGSGGDDVMSLAPNENSFINLGAIDAGETKMAYFYLQASATTANTQTHTINVYEEFSGAGAVNSTADFDLTVDDTIQANSSKVITTLIGPDPATIGGIVTIIFEGTTGTIGSADDGTHSFTPATYTNWHADAYQLLSASIEFGEDPDDPNTPADELGASLIDTFTDQLWIRPSDFTPLDTSDKAYRATYRFRLISTTVADTPLSPTAYISSGNQIKHSNVGATDDVIGIVSNPLLLEKEVSTSSLGITGGEVTYTVTVTNSAVDNPNFPGDNDAILDSFIDVLPSSPANATYVASSATIDGSPAPEPSITGQTLQWDGTFSVPAGGSIVLTYDVTIPGTAGVYSNEAVADIQGTQIDTTIDTTDDAPGIATVTVSANQPPVDPNLGPETDADGDTVSIAAGTTDPNGDS
ncbi:MAG: hypothetical protein ACSHX8_14350, partial [Opitutaceae bacterium]